MLEQGQPAQERIGQRATRLQRIAVVLWGAGLAAFLYLGLIRPAPLFAGSGSLPEPLLPWLGALALLVLATTPSAWRWFYLRRRQGRVGGPVRVAAQAGRVALLCPLSIGAWLCCRHLNTQFDSGGTLAALSVLYLASALLTLSSTRHWLVKRWRGR
jgi:hypothetical protein